MCAFQIKTTFSNNLYDSYSQKKKKSVKRKTSIRQMKAKLIINTSISMHNCDPVAG